MTREWDRYVAIQSRYNALEERAQRLIGPSVILLRELYADDDEVGIISRAGRLIVGTPEAIALTFNALLYEGES